MCEEIWKEARKRKEAKEKHPWVQLKDPPALPREGHFMRTNGREPELLQPIKLGVKKIKDLDFFFLSRDYEKKRDFT